MKYLVSVAALLLGTIALVVRSGAAPCESLPRFRPKRVEEISRLTGNLDFPGLSERLPRQEAPKDVSVESKVHCEPRKSDLGSTPLERSLESMLCCLKRTLDLGPDQFLLIARVLGDRQKETEEFFKVLRDSRVFCSSEFDRRVEGIRERSYRRISEVLDSAQYQIYSGLLAQGKLGDSVAFEITSGMIVVD